MFWIFFCCEIGWVFAERQWIHWGWYEVFFWCWRWLLLRINGISLKSPSLIILNDFRKKNPRRGLELKYFSAKKQMSRWNFLSCCSARVNYLPVKESPKSKMIKWTFLWFRWFQWSSHKNCKKIDLEIVHNILK